MRYQTIIQKGTMLIFQKEFNAESDIEAQQIHFENIKVCDRDIDEDWDTESLALTDAHGDIARFVL